MGEMIEIKCNNCEYDEQIAYGNGFAGNHDFYYCPKCFKLSEYFTSINEIMEFSNFLNCRTRPLLVI